MQKKKLYLGFLILALGAVTTGSRQLEEVASIGSDSNSGLNLSFTRGFFEFDEGPEDELRRGDRKGRNMPFAHRAYFQEVYYRDRNYEDSNGMLGFWGSISFGEKGERPARQTASAEPREREGLLANLFGSEARDASRASANVTRVRTRRADPEDAQKPFPVLNAIFGKKQESIEEPTAPAFVSASQPAVVEAPAALAPEASPEKRKFQPLKKLFGKGKRN